MSVSAVRQWLQHNKLLTCLGQKWSPSPVKSFRRQRSSETLSWSYVSNPGTWPLLGIHLGQMVDRAEDMFGDREAIVSIQQGKRRTFSQVKQEVNINPAYRPNEMEYCLNKVSVKAIICHEKFKTSDYHQMLCQIAPELLSSSKDDLNLSRLPFLKRVIMCSEKDVSGAFKFGDLYDAGDTSHVKILGDISARLKSDDPFNIQFTSGTTGFPKAAILTHHMLVNNAYGVGKRAQYNKSRVRICLSVPLYHCFGCVAGALTGALYGATCVLPTEAYNPEACVQAIQDERVSSCYGTPTMFVDILNEQRRKPRDISSLSTGIMAGAPCPQELVMAVMNDLNMKDFMVMYGMTETSPVSFQCYPTDSPQVKSSTIGFPSDHIEAKVADEDGQVVRIGEAGELCIRGYCNFLGYWGDPEKTEETMGPDRWLKTGDLAVLQPDGYGQIIGRIKDLIIRGGENIYPAEIENFFLGHPSIIEAQVFSVPDARMGEEVAAWIRKADDAELTATTLKEWCKGKIAHYKVPRYILFKDEFPKTVTGKIQKFVMRDVTMKELNLN
ncbi:hypothetical protein OTU49_011186 [Cherax quadricarinatus]|uniref:Medium-chain acyl-CoA ligase ACSF2, mitochondrial n=1 Tax=Cherax quadricarinatus TaxID=27406 RepID=A0AAW0W5G0_CHEQU